MKDTKNQETAVPGKKMKRHIGVDIGGTFTDIVCITSDGSVLTRKVSSTVDDYSRSISESLPGLLEEDGGPMSSVQEIVHGTTVATNAILERKGAKTGLITTKGFRDVLELRRIRMPELYNWLWDKPPDLVERQHRKEVAERIDAKGNVLTPLDNGQLQRCLTELAAEGIESLAVCYLNSYANPRHEEETAAVVKELHPELRCSVSSEILREVKEYERTATVVVNAYVLPLVQDYIRSLRSSLDQIDIRAPLLIMQSNGGTMTAEACMRKPVFAIESGPAAGVIASLGLVRSEGIPNAITFDMGGTTAKASIIEGGRLNMASEYEVGSSLSMVSRLIKGSGHLIRVPAIDIAEVGAGGGSIAWVDQGGALQVGPRSAGAHPGPVSYEIGGERVTITDANLVLGYINPEGLAGGTISLNRSKAEEALISQVGKPLGLELLECAHGVHLIGNSNMMRAIRSVSTERGRDVRGYGLIAFGGSGPIHAAGIARALGMKEVVVPASPGLFSAFGLLFADIQHDFVQTYYSKTREVDLHDLNGILGEMEKQVRQLLEEEGYGTDRIVIERLGDLRYVGQSYELTIPLPEAPLDEQKITLIERAFADEHENTYGHRATDGEEYTFVNLRVRGRGLRRLESPKARVASRSVSGNSRWAYFGKEDGRLEVPVVSRGAVGRDFQEGPLMIDEYDSTTVVPTRARVRLDSTGNIRIQLD